MKNKANIQNLSDFDNKTLPLMISMINTICDEKTLKFEWKNFK